MVFAPNKVFYKSPTSIGLENRESTPNEKNPKKMAFETEKGKPKITQMCNLNVIHVLL